jgi:hypothetical protein
LAGARFDIAINELFKGNFFPAWKKVPQIVADQQGDHVEL